MKLTSTNYIITFFLLIILSCTDTKTKINSNKSAVNLQIYKIKLCDYFDESTEGGEVKGYYIKDKIERIKVILYLELGRTVKEFVINNNVSNSYTFKKEYYYYNKPFHYKDFKVVDSLTISGTFNNGKIIVDTIFGKNIDEIKLNKATSNINSEIESYIQFLEKCTPR